jgi:hypothetical protein
MEQVCNKTAMPLNLPHGLYEKPYLERLELQSGVYFLDLLFYAGSRVARWFVFKPKIRIWVNFGGSCNGR